MDTSKEYIEMCEKAVEIQNIIPDDLSYAFKKKRGAIIAYQPMSDGEIFVCPIYYESINKNSFIWLPRQDQIQEVVRGEDHPLLLLDKFHEWTLSIGYDLKSLEQYWLAFVMRTKYGKAWWSGREWVAGE